MPKRIFLCHSSTDKGFARRLAADLRARGLRVWIDEAEIRVGDSLIGKIEAALEEVDYLAAILSKTSVQSEWVLKELRVAMHRELEGHRVLVLPLLFEECSIPGFLRDKLYIDFRNPIHYQHSVAQIVSRIDTDADEELGVTAFLDQTEFTRVWKQALATKTFSDRFLGYCQRTLRRMKGGDKSWDPVVASSYCFFVTEILKTTVQKEAWTILCRLVEDEEISAFLRYFTLDRMTLAAMSENILPRGWKVPDIVQPITSGIIEDLVTLCLETFFDPSKHQLVTTDRTGPTRVLAFLATNGNLYAKKNLLARMAHYMEASIPGSSHSLEAFSAILSESSLEAIESALIDLREKWADLEAGSIESDRRKIELVLDNLTNGAPGSKFSDLLVIFKRQPTRPGGERHDFEVWATLARVFTDDVQQIFRERHGHAELYRFLADIVVSPDIDLEFSYLALVSLVNQFGLEGLALDDRIPEAMLEPRKQIGQEFSMVESLCDQIKSSVGKDDFSALVITAALHHVFDEAQRKRLMNLIAQCLPEYMKVIDDLFSERIAVQQAQKMLEKLRRHGRSERH